MSREDFANITVSLLQRRKESEMILLPLTAKPQGFLPYLSQWKEPLKPGKSDKA